MNLKLKMLKESLGYQGTNFEANLNFSNLIKDYGTAIREDGLMEAYVSFMNKENIKVMNYLNENIGSVLALSAVSSPLLLEGYYENNSDDYSANLNEDMKSVLAGFVLKIMGQKKLLAATKFALNKYKVSSFEQAAPIIREIAKKGKVPLATLKAQMALGSQVASGKLDPKVAFQRTQQVIDSSGVIKEKKLSTSATKAQNEEFLKGFKQLLTEKSWRDNQDVNALGGPSNSGDGMRDMEEFIAKRKAANNADSSAQHGGYQYADQEQRKASWQKPADTSQNSSETDSHIAQASANGSAGQAPDAGGALTPAASMAASLALNKTITGFVAGIPIVGPFLAPFAPYIAGMLVPIVLGLLFRRKK
jgi:hypothetical protein